MTTPTTATLHMQIYKLQSDLADARARLAGTEDRLTDALATSQEWRRLYRELWEQQMKHSEEVHGGQE